MSNNVLPQHEHPTLTVVVAFDRDEGGELPDLLRQYGIMVQ